MKRSLLITLVTLFTSISLIQAQNVFIPDVAFKNYLVGNSSINTNLDAEIQISEAAAYTGTINVDGLGINFLSGIEFFTSLTGLYCSNNSLTFIDVSANTSLIALNCSNNPITSINTSGLINLISLYCQNNQLSNLDVSSNTGLIILYCTSNQLTSLDLSSNTNLNTLSIAMNQITTLDLSSNITLLEFDCVFNQLSSLDVSLNTSLTTLFCSNNQISSLDLSSNTSLSQLTCSNNNLSSLNIANGNNNNIVWLILLDNPNLTCIEVDNATFMNSTWPNAKDAGASYNVDCSTADIVSNTLNTDFVVFPNPTNGTINLSESMNITITDLLGKVLLKKENTKQIEINNQPVGMYIILVSDAQNQLVQSIKITKE